jgi:hypothetical protein
VLALEVFVKRLAHARRHARSVVLGGLLASGVFSTDIAAAGAEDSVEACVAFHNESGEKRLLVHASNTCERRLSCTLDYTVLCEDVEGKQTSRSERREPFQLGKKGSQTLSLSAEACRQGWRIDELRWTCS